MFDNTAQILAKHGGTQVVHLLQDTAKQASDEGFMVVLFASSESSVTKIMCSRSAKSRLRHTIQVGDITNEEAFKYLTCMCPKASEEDVQKAVDLFGGRFMQLMYAASALDSGEAGLAILRTIFKDIETSITRLPLKVREVLTVVVHNVLQSSTKMVTIDNYYNTFARELTEEDLKLIDMTNILDIEPLEGVFLASRIVETYFKQKFSNSTPQV